MEVSPPQLPNYQRGSSRYTLNTKRFWPRGKTVTVAFQGGDNETRALVKRLAEIWSTYGNIKFDFGGKDRSGSTTFYEWDETDDEYAADVRISFEQSGYWSAIGTDSIDPTLFQPDHASMNLNIDDAPASERNTAIIHEFGHVCGFLHEHQRPDGACDKEFRWTDETGYQVTKDKNGMLVEDAAGRRPGIYTWLAGPPNKLPPQWIDHNLKSMPKSSAYLMGPNDRQSIMHYHFPEFFYRRGTSSPCFAKPTSDLSRWDKIGLARAYPYP